MNVAEFNEKYGRGGMATLTEMRALLHPQDQIAQYFGVTKEGVRKWMKQFFGEKYDPRYSRRDSIIASMVKFAGNNPKEEFDEAYKSHEYYKEALRAARAMNIYES